MKTERLGDICTVVSGSTPKSTVSEYWDGDIAWITPAELNDNSYIIEDSIRHITQKAVMDTNLKPFPAGTVILSSRAPIGKTAIAGREMYCNQGFKNLICSPVVDNKYLYFFLSCKTDYLNSLGRGATFKEISKSIVEDIEVPLPDVIKQREIASIFELMQGLKQDYNKQLSFFDQLVKSRFVEMFGTIEAPRYGTRKIKEIVDVCSGGTPKRDNELYWHGGKIPWVKTTELKNTVILDVEESITELGLSESSAKLVPAGTVLIAMYGQGKTRGMTGYLGIEASTNQACACLISKKHVNQKYLWHYLILSYEKLRGLAQGGNQPNLNADMIKNFDVILPPMEEQNTFVGFAEQVDKSKFSIRNSLQHHGKLWTASGFGGIINLDYSMQRRH